MASIAPLLLLAGGAVLLAGKKKKKAKPALDQPVRRGTASIGGLQVQNASLENPIFPFSDIKSVQEALIEAGYPLPKYGADGKWGPESEAAMMAFVADQGGRKYGRNDEDYIPKFTMLWDEDFTKLANVVAGFPINEIQPFCDISAPEPCHRWWSPGTWECIPLFALGEAPAGFEDLGYCIPKSLIFNYVPAVGPDDYRVGGYDTVMLPPYGFLAPEWEVLAKKLDECESLVADASPASVRRSNPVTLPWILRYEDCQDRFISSLLDYIYIGSGFFLNQIYPWMQRQKVSAFALKDPARIEINRLAIAFMRQARVVFPGRGLLPNDIHPMNEIAPGEAIKEVGESYTSGSFFSPEKGETGPYITVYNIGKWYSVALLRVVEEMIRDYLRNRSESV